MFRYGIRFAEPSYILPVTFNAVLDNVTFPATGSLDPNTDYFFLGNGAANDLCFLLAEAITSHDGGEIASTDVVVDAAGRELEITVTPVGAVDGLQLHWSTASLDATVFGWLADTDSDLEDLTLVSPNLPMGLVYLERPVTDDSRPRQPVVGGLVQSLDGNVEATTLDLPLRHRMLSVEKLHRSLALEEYAPATEPYNTLESLHVRAAARGHTVHYVPDDTAPLTYDVLRLRPPLEDRMERDTSTQSRMLWKWSADFVQVGSETTPLSSFVSAYSYIFDGSGDYISMGDVANFDGATACTWSWWQYVPSWPLVASYVWSKRDTTATQMCFWFQLTTTNQRMDFSINSAAGTNATGQTSAGTFDEDVWQHVVVVYNGAGVGNANRLRVYLDGVQLTIATFVGTVPAAMVSGTTSAMNIGAAGGGNVVPNGTCIDEAACWVGTAASAGQVLELYNGGVPGDVSDTSLSDPTFWYRADGDTGTTATDHGTAGTDGTYNGNVALSLNVP